MVIFLYLVSVGSMLSTRFIMGSIIEDKRTKMRETLRMMSLSQFSYALSFLISSGVPAVLSGLIIGAIVFGDSVMFSNASIGSPALLSIFFTIALVIYNLSSIAFLMVISTFFNDLNTGMNVGGLITGLPVLIYFQLIGSQSWVIYLFYWIPTIPATDIMMWCLNPNLETVPIALDNSYINQNVSWIALGLNLPLWIGLYLYLDSIMPSEYGIQKHPLYCLRKQRPTSIPTSFAD